MKWHTYSYIDRNSKTGVCMLKRIWICFFALLFGITTYAKEEPEQLYAQSAVLMDADSGRILFEKNGNEQKPMASTTKIMTCILALEEGNPEDVVTASAYAERQPKVHLDVKEGERYRLQDLLYSLMLESHNDSAVMIAEHIGGSVKGFAELMNAKAKKIGCKDTYFVTPNGLDASDEKGKHSTTAADLARIMSYCIKDSEKKEEFIRITGAKSYEFSDIEHTRTFSCSNHNAFLTMMEGAFSGKTGFTGEAGYCYVGALKRDDRTFVVALLGCGWPNNKTYKWSDTKKLMQYGLDNYRYKDMKAKTEFEPVKVRGGIPESESLRDEAEVNVMVEGAENMGDPVLMKEGEDIRIRADLIEEFEAPVQKGKEVGKISYYLNGELFREYKVVAAENVEKITIGWCIQKVLHMYIDL